MTHNFIISNNKLILQDYNIIKYNKKYIYYHNDLPIFLGSINSNMIIIIGFAYRIDTITDDLLFGYSSFEKVLELLSGKFLIIYDNKLYVDFYNSFDVFFSKKLNLITNNCIAQIMKIDSMGGMNCISLFNNYKICKYMLQFFKYRIHEISLRICESNKFLWNLPFNSLNKTESNKKIEFLKWSLNNTFLLNSESDIWI